MFNWEKFKGESVTICRDGASGLVGVIAIDSSTLGPALGGIRLHRYQSIEDAIAECTRLARAMTLKNALADTGFGGGKSVMLENATLLAHREEALEAFGRFIARTGGSYVPAVDMGTSVEDLRVVARTAPDVADDVDPSPATADGLHAAIGSAIRATGVARSLAEVSVLVQGVGHVGSLLARLLSADGARLFVCDVHSDRAEVVARQVGATVVSVEEALTVQVDVLAPCATAKVINAESVGQLRARVIAGAANDQLSEPDMAQRLLERGVAYVPDFVASAGGVIQIRAQRDEWSPERLKTALLEIGARTSEVLEEARRSGRTTLSVAEEAADRRITTHTHLPVARVIT